MFCNAKHHKNQYIYINQSASSIFDGAWHHTKPTFNFLKFYWFSNVEIYWFCNLDPHMEWSALCVIQRILIEKYSDKKPTKIYLEKLWYDHSMLNLLTYIHPWIPLVLILENWQSSTKNPTQNLSYIWLKISCVSNHIKESVVPYIVAFNNQ